LCEFIDGGRRRGSEQQAGFLLGLIDVNYSDRELRRSLREAAEKMLDMNLDVMSISYREEELKKVTAKEVKILIHEIKRPELDSYLVAEAIASQLEGRISFRRAMKQAITQAMRMGSEGIRVMCAGRLGGAEIARTEHYKDGRIPLQTIRADIDYATATARTIYGAIGVKVWICKGEILGGMNKETRS